MGTKEARIGKGKSKSNETQRARIYRIKSRGASSRESKNRRDADYRLCLRCVLCKARNDSWRGTISNQTTKEQNQMSLTPEMRRAMERKPALQEAEFRKGWRETNAKLEKPLNHVEEWRTVITITGQIRGGKNSVQTTKTGRRYPNKVWAKWRDNAVREVVAQIPKGWEPISEHTNVRMEYFAGDKRRRDMPAIIDACFHVLEKAGFTEDDTHLWVAESSRAYDKENPRLIITIL